MFGQQDKPSSAQGDAFGLKLMEIMLNHNTASDVRAEIIRQLGTIEHKWLKYKPLFSSLHSSILPFTPSLLSLSLSSSLPQSLYPSVLTLTPSSPSSPSFLTPLLTFL